MTASDEEDGNRKKNPFGTIALPICIGSADFGGEKRLDAEKKPGAYSAPGLFFGLDPEEGPVLIRVSPEDHRRTSPTTIPSKSVRD